MPPLKLPAVPTIPTVPSFAKIPKLPVPVVPAIPGIASIISKILSKSKIQLPTIKISNLGVAGAIKNQVTRLQTQKDVITTALNRVKLPLNSVARLKEQAESYKSKFSFETIEAAATAGLTDKLAAAKKSAASVAGAKLTGVSAAAEQRLSGISTKLGV